MCIDRRVVFTEVDSNGRIRFADWAQVTVTGAGTFAEPFCGIGARVVAGASNLPDFDWNDDMQRIDEIRGCSMDSAGKLACGSGDEAVIGGTLMPRVGR